MGAKCTCQNCQDQTALVDSVSCQSGYSLNFVHLLNDVLVPLSQNVLLALARVPLVPQTSAAPGPLKQGQAHNMNLAPAGQRVKQWGALSAETRLNRGQHAEMTLQAISFIHINLGKVAKCVKLIRLIDFFSGSQTTLVPLFGRDIDLYRTITFPGTVEIFII